MTTATRDGWHYVPGHEADPQGRIRRPLVKTLMAAGVWLLLPGRVQGLLCHCPLDRGLGES